VFLIVLSFFRAQTRVFGATARHFRAKAGNVGRGLDERERGERGRGRGTRILRLGLRAGTGVAHFGHAPQIVGQLKSWMTA